MLELTEEQINSIHRYKYLDKIPKGELGFCIKCGNDTIPLYNEGYIKSLQRLHDDNIKLLIQRNDEVLKLRAELENIKTKLKEITQ